MSDGSENYDDLRAEVRAIMENEGKSYGDIAAESGIPRGTLSPWMAGTYPGPEAPTAAKVKTYLESRKAKAQVIIPTVPGYQETETALAIHDTLRFAHVMPDLSVYTGPAGIGKTSAINQYQKDNSNVWIVTIDRSTSELRSALLRTCEALKIDGSLDTKSSEQLVRRIVAHIRDKNGLLIYDEAQYLSSEALDQIRSMYDASKQTVGIAFVGNASIYTRLVGAGEKEDYAQLYSRLGVRRNQPKVRTKDALCLLDAWGIEGKEERSYLRGVAGMKGGLRTMTKCIRLAMMLAAGAGGAPSMTTLKEAHAQLSGSQGN